MKCGELGPSRWVQTTLGCSLWVLLMAGCASEPSLTIDLQTDLTPGLEFTQVVTHISRSAPGAERDQLLRDIELVVDVEPGDERFLDGDRIAEIAALPPGEYWVEVLLREADGRVLIRQTLGPVPVLDDTARTVRITRDCVGVECPGSGPPGNLACLAGMCVDPRCSPEEPEFCPPLSCEEDADCTPPAIACADTRCVSGTCFVFSPGASCPDGSTCDADVGCAPTGRMPPSCVTPVCSTGNECLLGRLDCDGMEVCAPWANAFAGSPCARGECDGEGACVGLPLELTIEGVGQVVSDPAGVDCSAGTCASRFERDALVTLIALETDTSVLDSWSGACESTDGTRCFVRMTEARDVTATFVAPLRHVTVVVSGGGGGMVEGGGISCGSACEIDVPSGSTLTLTATPTGLDRFGGWGGACSSAATETCDLTITTDTVVGASFVAAADDVLRVVRLGTGAGDVSSTPAGISCGSTCAAGYSRGTMVTLTAVQSPGSTFAGWSGDAASCGRSPTCEITLSSPLVTAEATFTRNRVRVTVELAGRGTGEVTSPPGGIRCPAGACSADFDELSSVRLTANPSPTSMFARWELVPSCGSGLVCTFDADAPITIRAVFDLAPVRLTVTKTGAGAGIVREDVMGALRIDCGADCTEDVTPGDTVPLIAVPQYGSEFVGWSGTGECTGSGNPCTATIGADATVTARFDVRQWRLTVSLAGSGSGTVTGGSINCGSTCAADFPHNDMVTLNTTASPGSTFAGWSGACSGTGSCVVTMDAAKSVTANFSASLHSLSIARTGEGTVSETMPGSSISCGSTCSADYAEGTRVTLVGSPAECYDFTGWGAPCSGIGPCTVTVSGPTTLPATFEIRRFNLRVSGVGGATIRSGSGSIDCGRTCEATYDCGSVASLEAGCPRGYRIDSWSLPSCGSSTSCDVAISADTSVTATCVPITRTLSVGMTGAGTGRVVSTPAGIDCSTGAGAGCSSDFDDGQMVTLKADPTGGWCFREWSLAPGCGTDSTCVVTMDMARSVEARFDTCPSETCRLNVTTSGLGAVTSSPGGISCPRTCGADYLCSQRVTLQAISELPVTWRGCVVGRDPTTCTVTFPPTTANVTATFGGGPAL